MRFSRFVPLLTVLLLTRAFTRFVIVRGKILGEDSLSARNDVLLKYLQLVGEEGLPVIADEDEHEYHVGLHAPLEDYPRFSPRFSIADADGHERLCEVRSLGGDFDDENDDRDVVRSAFRSFEDMLDNVGTICRSFTKGYWTYEWCHRSRVRQYHKTYSKEGAAIEEKAQSLGTYVFRDTELEATKEPKERKNRDVGDVRDFIDIFESGDPCDEGKGDSSTTRSTKVRFACCASEHIAMPMRVFSVDEPEACTYEITVCVLEACYLPIAGDSSSSDNGGSRAVVGMNTSSSSSPAPLTAQVLLTRAERTRAAVVRVLTNQCWTRRESWWTYKICFGKHVRQYHTLNVKTQKGTTKQVVDQEFMLGYNNATSRSLGADADEIHSLSSHRRIYLMETRSTVSDDVLPASDAFTLLRNDHDVDSSPSSTTSPTSGEGLYVVEEDPSQTSYREFFRFGMSCDTEDGSSADGTERSIEVRYLCGGKDKTVPLGVVSVAEVHTCTYVAVVNVPSLCSHPLFHAPQKPRHRLVCKERVAPGTARGSRDEGVGGGITEIGVIA